MICDHSIKKFDPKHTALLIKGFIHDILLLFHYNNTTFNYLDTVKAFYFVGQKFRCLKTMDMFVGTWHFMDCPTHEIHEIKKYL